MRKDNDKTPNTNVANELLKAQKEIYMLRQQLKRAQEQNKVLGHAERIFPEKK